MSFHDSATRTSGRTLGAAPPDSMVAPAERRAAGFTRRRFLADVLSTVAFLLGPDRFDWPEAETTHFIG